MTNSINAGDIIRSVYDKDNNALRVLAEGSQNLQQTYEASAVKGI